MRGRNGESNVVHNGESGSGPSCLAPAKGKPAGGTVAFSMLSSD